MNKQSLSGAHAAGFAIFCAAKPASAGHHELRAKAVKEDDSVEIIIYNRDSRARKHVRKVLQKSEKERIFTEHHWQLSFVPIITGHGQDHSIKSRQEILMLLY